MKNPMVGRRAFLFSIVIWAGLTAAAAQVGVVPPPPQVPAASQPTIRDATFQSASLGRSMKYRVILPAGYEQIVQHYPVLYLLHGLSGTYQDWESLTRLDDYAAPLPLIIVMPDADNSWYTNSAGKPQDKFEDYIISDLIPEIDKTYRTIATRHARAIGGLSMGGYGALKFALKYPSRFIFAASFSSAMEVPHNPDFKIPFGGGKYDREAVDIFGGAGSATRLANDVFELALKADPASLPFLWLACGTEDGLLKSNQQFLLLLDRQKIAHAYGESPGAHTWAYWDEQLPAMLHVLMSKMGIAMRPGFPARVGEPALPPRTPPPPQPRPY